MVGYRGEIYAKPIDGMANIIKAEAEGKFYESKATFLISWHETFSGEKSLSDRLDIAAAKNEQIKLGNEMSYGENAVTTINLTMKEDGISRRYNGKAEQMFDKRIQSVFNVISKMTQSDYTTSLNSAKKWHSGQDPEHFDVDKPNRFPATIEDFKKDFIQSAIKNGVNLDLEASNKKLSITSSVKTILKSTIQQVKKTPKEALLAIGKDIGKGFNTIFRGGF